MKIFHLKMSYVVQAFVQGILIMLLVAAVGNNAFAGRGGSSSATSTASGASSPPSHTSSTSQSAAKSGHAHDTVIANANEVVRKFPARPKVRPAPLPIQIFAR